MLSVQEWEDTLAKISSLPAQSQSKRFINSVFNEEWKRRNAMQKEFFLLTEKVKEIFSNIENIEEKKAQILKKIENEISIFKNINNYLKEDDHLSKEASYALKTNKMEEVLQGTYSIIEKDFFNLVGSNFPLEKYDFQTKEAEVTILGREETEYFYNRKVVYGNSKATFLNTALTQAYLQGKGFNTFAGVPAFNELDSRGCTSWIAQSAFLYNAPLPGALSEKLGYVSSSYITSEGIAMNHSGYAFGGQRKIKSKYLGPEDCSSWIGKITLSSHPDALSTKVLMNAYRQGIQENVHLISGDWSNNPIKEDLEERYQAVKIRDPQQDIKPGQVWFSRLFKSDESQEKGSGGHTGVVLGPYDKDKGKVIVLSYAREMPEVEGFGIKLFPYQTKTTKDGTEEIGFFNLKL